MIEELIRLLKTLEHFNNTPVPQWVWAVIRGMHEER